jgi:hypothetical protein
MRLSITQFVAQPRHPNHIAEVIETSTTEFLAQCLDTEHLGFPTMPPFGSWVCSQDEDSGNQLYGIVYHVTTSPIDSIHRARALGLSLGELREQQPQIFALLKTEFRAVIVGFKPPMVGGILSFTTTYPPVPPNSSSSVSLYTGRCDRIYPSTGLSSHIIIIERSPS